MNSPAEISKIKFIDRILCLLAIMALHMLMGSNILGQFPKNEWLLVAKALSEILSFFVLYQIGRNSEVVRDLLDLCIFGLLLRIVILEAYFLNGDLYDWFQGGAQFVLTNALFLAGLTRLLWVRLESGRFVLAEWPIIGPIGLAWARQNGRIAGGGAQYFRVCAVFIGSLECACLLLDVDFGFYQLFMSLIGMGLIFGGARAIRESAVETLTVVDSQAKTIDRYEDLIRGFANSQFRHDRPAPNLVKVVDNTKSDD